jgi:hypothetical protein
MTMAMTMTVTVTVTMAVAVAVALTRTLITLFTGQTQAFIAFFATRTKFVWIFLWTFAARLAYEITNWISIITG